MKLRFAFAMLALMIAASGCNTLNTNWMPKAPWDKSDKLVESEFDAPVRMAAIWTPDIMVRPGVAASRGIGGRLYFYNQMNKPVKVEGQLVVYAYDDTVDESQRESPDRKYAFTPEQFTGHHSESELGASYSIWLPWDTETVGEQKSISLLPVFTSTTGKIVMGQQALNLLKGKKPQALVSEAAETAPSHQVAFGVRPAGFQDNSTTTTFTGPMPAREPSHRPSIRTTTIDLPKSMQQRIAEAAKNRDPIPATAADPVLVEKARATLEQLRANSSLPPAAGVQALPSPSSRFAPPRPRVPSGPTSRSAFSHAPTRPVQPTQQFDLPSTQTPAVQTSVAGFGSTFEQTGR